MNGISGALFNEVFRRITKSLETIMSQERSHWARLGDEALRTGTRKVLTATAPVWAPAVVAAVPAVAAVAAGAALTIGTIVVVDKVMTHITKNDKER